MVAEPRLELRDYPLLERIRSLLAQRGVTAYIVGGFVRDLCLGRASQDVDLALGGASPLEVARQVADALGGSYVVLDAPREMARVVLPAMSVDFTPLRGSLEEDLAQRDFAIDALAVDLSRFPQPPLIDPWGGRADIVARRVRVVHPGVFREDPARLLRGVRLAAETGFSLEPATAALIREQAALVTRAAAERLREELCKLLATPRGAASVFLLDDLGLLTHLLPELAEARGVAQPPEHHWDVFRHSLETVATAEALLERCGPPEVIAAVPWSPELAGHFQEEVSSGHRRGMLLKLAALLHDVAKPRKRTQDEGGRIHFYSHAKEGAEMAQAALERLRFSGREARMVSAMVAYHLRPRQMVSQDDQLPTPRAIYRYFRDTAEVAIDTLYLNLADHWASRGPGLLLEPWQRHTAMVAYVLEQWRQRTAAVAPPRLITGHDLIRELGLSPGPLVGEVLEVVKEAQAAGQVTTREEALAWADSYLAQRSGATT